MSDPANTPTVVLVHGSFADSSYWVPVIEDLQAHNISVVAPPNPLRGLAPDAEYTAAFVNQIDGPVLLVGHSHGGAVITVTGLEHAERGRPEALRLAADRRHPALPELPEARDQCQAGAGGGSFDRVGEVSGLTRALRRGHPLSRRPGR
jgi:pimeloyl-ACP methyl ester carboxylesterase